MRGRYAFAGRRGGRAAHREGALGALRSPPMLTPAASPSLRATARTVPDATAPGPGGAFAAAAVLRRWLRLGGLCGALALAGCVSEEVRASAEAVLTLRSGTMSDLRARRGHGPFREYDLPPKDLLEVVAAAARRARGAGGAPVRAVFVAPARGEVVAKERTGADAARTGYGAPFVSAMLAVVHPVPDQPLRSRLEVHEIRSGPFHAGVVRWVRDLPRWIDAERAERARPKAPGPRVQPIP